MIGMFEKGATGSAIHETEKVREIAEERRRESEGVQILDGVTESERRLKLTIRGEERLWIGRVARTNKIGETQITKVVKGFSFPPFHASS